MLRESTGDIYTTKPITADRLEYLGDDGQWYPLRAKAETPAMSLPDAPRGLLDTTPAPELPAWMPRSKDFEEARQAAMLPPEQGGLGLGPANTAAERARAGGYVNPVFHATDAPEDFPAFRLSDEDQYATITGHPGISTETSPDRARYFVLEKKYGEGVDTWNAVEDGLWSKNERIMPLLGRGNTQDIEDVFQQGLSPLTTNIHSEPFGMGDEFRYLRPEYLRSRFAAFNPKKRNESDLLASWLLPALGLGGLLGLGYSGQGEQTY
jgi:hypothetical protein